ncbi:MAG: apolipoprotein N-acyltransferase, partial [Akkermansiaceae bacterium]
MKIWQRIALVILSAGLGILVFPPIGLWWLAVVAWVPLLLALADAKPSHALYLGLLHGLVFYGVTMSWLLDVFADHPEMFVPLISVMSLFTAVFARGCAVACARYRAGWTVVVFAAVWWLACEFFRSEIFYLKFPWMTPGLGLGPTWISPLLGVSGAGFLIVIGSAACAQWKMKNKVAFGSALLALMLASSYWQSKKEMPQNTSVRVLAVQNEEGTIDAYTLLTREAGGEHDFIVWPEHALGFDVRKNKHAWKELKDFSKEMDALIVVGTRTELDNNKWYNTALTVSPDGSIGEHYKNHPVHFFDDGEPAAEANAVDTPLGKIGTSICFDNDYQDVARRMIADGAEILLVPSMDAISWGEKQHYQHAEMARHRA